MYKILKKAWSVFFIVAVWLLFSFPYFALNKVPYPAKHQVSSFNPWNQYEKYAGPVQNNAIPDVINQIYPWKYFTIQSLKNGQLPLWNPYSFSGNPHLANYQTAVLSPFNLLFFLLPFIDAWSLVVLLQSLLAGLFTYLFLKELKISKIGCLIGSIAFMFCGFMSVWLPYGTLSMTVAFLPLLLFAINKVFGKFSFYPLALLSVGILFVFLSGHFQTALYVVIYAFSYLIFNLFISKNKKPFLWVILFFAIGVLMSLIQILPSLEFYKEAARSSLFTNSGGIPMQYLVTIFSPDFFGNPVTRNDWYGYYVEWASFIGIIPLTLASIAIWSRRSKNTIFFFFSGIVALLLAIDSPIQKLWIFLKIPIFGTSIPSRIIVLFSFSFAVLAALGFDNLKSFISKKETKNILPPIFFVGAILILIWALLFISKIMPTDKLSLARHNLILPTFVFFLAAGIIFLNTLKKNKRLLYILTWGLLVLTVFDSLRFASKWVPFDSREIIFPSVPVITAMQKDSGYSRVYGDFKAYIDTYYNLQSIEGYDPLYSRRYGELLTSSKNGQFTNAQKSEVFLDRRGKYVDRILDLLGVGIIYQPISYTNQQWAYPVWENPKKYSVIYRDDKFQLFKNNSALPRTKLFTKYEVIKNDQEIISRFYNKDFDFRNILILEDDPKISITDKDESSNAKITNYSPNKIVISVFADRKSLLFLSDNYYPTWKAVVNSKQVKIYRADYTFRAVVVPEGRSVVEFYIVYIDSLF